MELQLNPILDHILDQLNQIRITLDSNSNQINAQSDQINQIMNKLQIAPTVRTFDSLIDPHKKPPIVNSGKKLFHKSFWNMHTNIC